MKTTLDIPEDLMGAVQRQAEREGVGLAELILHLVRCGLLLTTARARPEDRPPAASSATFEVDPKSGLPLIHSPPDAPVRSGTVEQILALEEAALVEDDLERAGLSLRQ